MIGRAGCAAALVAALAGGLANRPGAQTPVQVTAIDGKRSEGALGGLDPQGRVVLTSAAGEIARPVDELREIVHPDAVAAEQPPAGLVVLWSGQTLRGNVRGVRQDAAGSALLCELPPARGLVALPQRVIRALRCTDQARADGEGFDDALRESTGKDLLFAYRRGDPAQGLVRLSVATKRFEHSGDEVRVVVEFDGKEQPAQPLSKLYGLVLGQGAAPDVQRGARVTAHVAGGASFTGALVALDAAADRCVLRLDEGCDLDLPWRHVARLAVRSDRLVYLSDLEPIRVEQTPAFNRKWEWTRDRAPLGPNIVVRGDSFARGLVLVPRTRLVFDIGERFDHFEAVVGIDDRAGDVADAEIRVLGDDKVLFEAKHVKRGALPHLVKVSVKGVRRLALEADFGDNLDLSDHCAFAEARVLRDG